MNPGRALVALLVAAALAGCGGAGPLATGGLMTADEAPDPNKVAAPTMPGDKPPVKAPRAALIRSESSPRFRPAGAR